MVFVKIIFYCSSNRSNNKQCSHKLNVVSTGPTNNKYSIAQQYVPVLPSYLMNRNWVKAYGTLLIQEITGSINIIKVSGCVHIIVQGIIWCIVFLYLINQIKHHFSTKKVLEFVLCHQQAMSGLGKEDKDITITRAKSSQALLLSSQFPFPLQWFSSGFCSSQLFEMLVFIYN